MKTLKNLSFYFITLFLKFLILDFFFNFINFSPSKWSAYELYGTYGLYWHGANHIDGDHKPKLRSLKLGIPQKKRKSFNR